MRSAPATSADGTHENGWRALQELAALHPDATVGCFTDAGQPAAIPPVVGALFPRAAHDLTAELSPLLPDYRSDAVHAFVRCREAQTSQCLGRRQSAPDDLLLIHLVNLLPTLNVVVAVDTATDEADTVEHPGGKRFAVRARRMVHITDEAATLLSIDDATTTILGWTPADVVGCGSLDQIHPDDHDRAISMWIDVLAESGRTRQCRVRYRHADGRWIWVETTNHNLLDTEGHVAREVVDVSDEMAALTAARSRDAVLRRLGEALPSGIAEFDAHGVLVYASDRCEQILGMRAVNLLDYLDLRITSHGNDFRQAIRSFVVGGADIDMEIAILRPGANLRDAQPHRRCQLSINAIYSDEGEQAGSVLQVHDVTEQWVLQQTLAAHAERDPLTNLPNRRSLVRSLEQSLRDDPPGQTAVLFLDLNGFKSINDRFGHAAGDELLRTVARSLTAVLRPSDSVGRQGGDEFIVVCRRVNEEDHALRIAQRLMDAVAEPVSLGGTTVTVKVSCGITLSTHGSTSEGLLMEADLAMYEQKRAGTRGAGRFRPAMFAVHREELDRAEALKTVGEDGSLHAWFQPLVDLSTDAVIGYEALARWMFQGRLLTPDAFIELAEDRGLIQEIGSAMVRATGAVADQTQALPGAGKDLLWTINVSPLQLRDQRLLRAVERVLATTSLQPHQLGLELTEGVMIADSSATKQAVELLDALGVKIIVDDFGTGFASLDYLRRFPVSGIKIDRAFTADIGDNRTRAIIANTVRLAEDLGLWLVVEGIETDQQRRMLVDMGAPLGQGYLFGRPSPKPATVTSTLAS